MKGSGKQVDMMRSPLLLALALLLTPVQSADPPQIFIYDRDTVAGSDFYLSTRNAEPDLVGYLSLELSPTSRHLTCRIGGWILYSGPSFTGTSTALPLARSLLCNHIAPGGGFRSARFAGSPADILVSTLTLYSGSGFVGQDSLLQANQTDISGLGPVGSVYRTGSEFWTLFTGINFTGFSFCMQEDTVVDLSAIMPIVQSVRRGC